MTPHTQSILHNHDWKQGDQVGDCFRTSIACILDLPIDSVPHFVQEQCDGGRSWRDSLLAWLEPQGLSVVELDIANVGKEAYGEAWLWIVAGGHCVISGISPRSPDKKGLHSVVGLNGEVIHDPHPTRAGLVGVPDDWRYLFIIKKF